MRVRFVGGTSHNRVREVWPILERIAINPTDIEVKHDPFRTDSERYQLHKFHTQRGTKYMQYVHESLLTNNGKPHSSAYKERFKPWSLSGLA